MGILDVVKQAIGVPAGESEQQREQKKLAKEIAEREAREAQALKEKPALDRQKADKDRLTEPGPTERLLNGRIVVPQPSQQQEPEREPVTPRTAEPMKLKPTGQQTAPSPGGAIFFPGPVRSPQTQSQQRPEPEKDSASLDIPPTPSQVKVMERLRPPPEDLADQVARELREKRQAEKEAYDRLSPEDRRTEDALNQLEAMKRGKEIRLAASAYERRRDGVRD